jgi:hypothetical protein
MTDSNRDLTANNDAGSTSGTDEAKSMKDDQPAKADVAEAQQETAFPAATPEVSGQAPHIQPPPGYYYTPFPSPPCRQTETLAIVSLVLSVMGGATCGLSSLVGAIMGQFALRKIRENPDTLDGEGLAKGGIIVGWVFFGVCTLLVVGYIAFLVFVFTQTSGFHRHR